MPIYASDLSVREAVQALGGYTVALLPSAARAGASALGVEGTAVSLPNAGFGQVEVLLDVTVAATDAGDTLDVYVDCSHDGVTYVNFVHFTQVLGNGGAKKFTAIVPRTGTAVMTDVTTDLTAGNMRAFFGSFLRVRDARVEAGTVNASFTYAVTATVKS